MCFTSRSLANAVGLWGVWLGAVLLLDPEFQYNTAVNICWNTIFAILSLFNCLCGRDQIVYWEFLSCALVRLHRWCLWREENSLLVYVLMFNFCHHKSFKFLLSLPREWLSQIMSTHLSLSQEPPMNFLWRKSICTYIGTSCISLTWRNQPVSFHAQPASFISDFVHSSLLLFGESWT